MPSDNKRERSESESPERNRSKIVKMEGLSTQIENLTTLMTNLTATVNQLATTVNQMKLEQTSMSADIGKVLTELKEENKKIVSRISNLELRMNDLEQNANKTSLIITGLPTTPLTSFEAFNHIMGFLKLQYVEGDCKRVVKINYKDGEGCFIIVNLYDEKIRDNIMKAFRERIKSQTPLTVEKAFKIDENSKLRGKQIRIKTLLTKHNATLLEQAYTLKGKPFEFVWETDGKIFVRVKEGGRATVIRSLEQLSKLAADNTTA